MKKFIIALSSVLCLTVSSVFAAPNDIYNHWASSAMNEASADGWLDVAEDGNFYPNDPAKRQEVVYMLYNAANNVGLKEMNVANFRPIQTYSDSTQIPAKYQYAVSVAMGNEIITGYPDGTIRGNSYLTRGEMAKIIANFLTKSKIEGEYKTYQDVIPEWADDSVALCSKAEIICGYDDGTFRADEYVTKAEAVVMIEKLCKFKKAEIQKAETTTQTTTETTTESTTESTTEETTETTTEIKDIDSLEYDEGVMAYLNIERENRGLSPVTINERVNEVAKLKAKEMYEQDYLEYDSPYYGSMNAMLDNFGFTSTDSSQCIAYGPQNAKQVIEYWLDAANEKDKMFTDGYSQIGVGYEQGYWVLVLVR